MSPPFSSGQPWSPSVPVLALEAQLPTGCPTTVHSAGAQVRSRRSKALGDSGAPGGVAELEKNLIDQPVLLKSRTKTHRPTVQGDSSRRERNGDDGRSCEELLN